MSRLAVFVCALALLPAASSRAVADEHVWLPAGATARQLCGAAPSGWQRADFDDRGWDERAIVFEHHDAAAAAPPSVPGEATDCRAAASRSPAAAAGSASGGAAANGPSNHGDGTARASDGGGISPRALAPSDGGSHGAFAVDGGAPVCSGARFVRWHFDADAATLATLRALTLRVRYTHGFAAYLNGSEVARRRLDPGALPESLASDVHGLELESFTIPAHALLHAGENILAVEVHPRTAGRATALEASLAGGDTPRMIRGPYLLNVRETEATIVVDTDLPTVATLRWGASARHGTVATDPQGVHHVLHLARLKPGTVYHYRVRLNEIVQTHNEAAPVPAGVVQTHNQIVQTHNEDGSGQRGIVQTHNEIVQMHNGRGSEPSDRVQAHKEPTHSPARELAADGVTSSAVDSGDIVFHTPPESGRPLRFAVYGDVRSGHDIHAALNRTLIEEQPDLAILTGDLVDRGTDEGEWESFFEIAAPLIRQICVFPAIGNHEYAKQGHGLATFMQLFRWPIAAADDPSWYSFDIAGAHFVALDSDQYKSPRQLGWFEHDLREARRRRVRAIFVYAHEGPASSGLHGDNPICVRDYVPIMLRYRVSMFFGGHDHDYERGRAGGLDYVVTGGGGAELRAPRCGVPGKRACPPRCAIFVNDHNYVMVELLPSLFRVCPKRVDGSPIEACIQYPLRP